MSQLGELWKRARASAAFIGMAGLAVRHGGNLFLLPIALHKLSSAEMALWAVFVVIGGIGNLADFGFGQAVTRVYSYFWAGCEDYSPHGMEAIVGGKEPNFRGLHNLTASVRRLYRWLSLIAAILLLAAGSWFVAPDHKFAGASPKDSQGSPNPEVSALPANASDHADSAHRTEDIYANRAMLWTLWLTYVAAILYTLGSSYWVLACTGINQVRDVQRANLWAGLVYALSAIILLLVGWGLASMVVATGLRALLTARICRQAYLRSIARGGLWDGHAKVDFLPRIWPSAWKFGVIALAVYFANQGTVLISRWYLSDTITGSYFVTMQVVTVIANVSSICLQVKYPQLTILRAQGAMREMSLLFARRLGWTVAAYVVLAAAFYFLGNKALELKGANTKFLSSTALLIVIIYAGQQVFTTQFIWLTYTENVVPFYLISICTGVGLVLISIPLTKHFGLWGLILAPVIAAIPATSWYPVWRGFQGQALSLGEFIRAALGARPRARHPSAEGNNL